ncbi:hypothetical protein GCM10020000_81110 [Streptomyces olivoverticillatus]
MGERAVAGAGVRPPAARAVAAQPSAVRQTYEEQEGGASRVQQHLGQTGGALDPPESVTIVTK